MANFFFLVALRFAHPFSPSANPLQCYIAGLCTVRASLEMPAPVPPARQWPRDLRDGLHYWAAYCGRNDLIDTILAGESMNVDHRGPRGITPLMIAADQGLLNTTELLLRKEADVFLANGEGSTALHLAAMKGHVETTKMLVKAGSRLETKNPAGLTPLHLASSYGRSEVMRALIEAGAKVDSRVPDGQTPLWAAAAGGHMDAVKELTRAGANPLLGPAILPGGRNHFPLQAASLVGHSEVVRELIAWYGVAGCGGVLALRDALHLAAENGNDVAVVTALFDEGLPDKGQVLITAAANGNEACVKFLLQQQQNKGNFSAYVNFVHTDGATPLLCSVGTHSSRPRIVRMLVDAGADTTLASPFHNLIEGGVFHGTPLALADRSLRTKRIAGRSASEKHLNKMELIRRVLLHVEAIHAVSWLWARVDPGIADFVRCTTRTKTLPTQLRTMLPILKQQAGARRVVLAAAFR